MQRHRREHHPQRRESPLPRSLIPHLYPGPQQSSYSETIATSQREDVLPTVHILDSTLQLVSTPGPSFGHHHRSFSPPNAHTYDRPDEGLPGVRYTPRDTRRQGEEDSSSPFCTPAYDNYTFASERGQHGRNYPLHHDQPEPEKDGRSPRFKHGLPIHLPVLVNPCDRVDLDKQSPTCQ